MKFQYLGTAAAEAIPAIFCTCPNCVRSREIGGRAIRTRSQAIIDDTLLIDLPCDTYFHFITHNVDPLKLTACLITHTHSDHLYPKELLNLTPTTAKVPEGYHIRFCGSDKVGEAIEPQLTSIAKYGRTSFTELKAFEPAVIGKYTVTPLPAIHDPNSGPFFYMISDGEKTVLYAHDTHYFHDDVWAYFEKTKPHFDLVSLDCTNACLPLTYIGHMGLPENVQVRDRMLEMGLADENTKFICNHYSHNGTHVVYDDFVPIAGKEGLLVSYDGMTVHL